MSTLALDALVRHQQALIAALDTGDLPGIEQASRAIEDALARVAAGEYTAGAGTRAAAEDALRLAEAARWRVNVLADQNEARITRMTQTKRAGAAAPTYGRNARLVRK